MMKFKVWDSEERKFVEPRGFFLSHEGKLFQRSFKEMKFYIKYTPVFSTGQTDKNGVEIYEGDIVKNVENEGTCSFHEGDIEEVVTNFRGVFPIGFYDDDCGESEDPKYWEIIGNKYENPELVEENADTK